MQNFLQERLGVYRCCALFIPHSDSDWYSTAVSSKESDRRGVLIFGSLMENRRVQTALRLRSGVDGCAACE